MGCGTFGIASTPALVLSAVVAACSPSSEAFDDGGGFDAEDHSDRVPDDGVADADSDAPDGEDADDGGDDEVDETEADADADGDADSGLPTGCQFVSPLTSVPFAWAGLHSIDAGKFVWRWIDETEVPSQDVLMVRDLATGTDQEVLRRTYPDVIEVPALHGDQVAFFSKTGGGDDTTAEIFRVSLSEGSPVRLTNNVETDAYPLSGTRYVVYTSEDVSTGFLRYAYVDTEDGSEHLIAECRGGIESAFDGERWFAFVSDQSLYKFDLLDPGAGPRLLWSYSPMTLGQGFDRDTGVLMISGNRSGESDGYRIEAWDLATDSATTVLDEAWDQVGPDVDGHVVAYMDSQASGEGYRPNHQAELRIFDRDTGAKRVVMPLDTYWAVGIWERWIVFNNYGRYGDSLITCDLVEAGYMDADLHVIPE